MRCPVTDTSAAALPWPTPSEIPRRQMYGSEIAALLVHCGYFVLTDD